MNIVGPSSKVLLFPHYVFEVVPVQQVQQALRQVFSGWGRPQALRVDNGPPWGNKLDLPSPLTLWLIGLEIDVIHNRPYRPEDNSKVERAHGVIKNWIEPSQCADFEVLKTRLDWAAQLQREVYPSCSGRTRLQTHPNLAHGARSYQSVLESSLWDFQRVQLLLAQYRWTRKVSQTGQISLYARHYSVGRPYAGQTVSVCFDPRTLEWVIENVYGQVIRRRKFKQFNAHNVRTLEITYRKPSRIKSTPGA